MNAIEEFLQKKQGDDKPVSYWISLLEDMLNDRRFEYAERTLEGIYDHVTLYNVISEKQIMAINNIWHGQNNNYYATRRKRRR